MRKLRFIIASLLIVQATLLSAAESAIGIIYPETKTPLDPIFQTIQEGIQLKLNGSGKTYRLDADSNAKTFHAWADKNHVKSIITLGRNAHRFVEKVNWSRKHITGGLYLLPDEKNTKGISIFVDPKKVHEALSDLFPSIRRVFIAGKTEKIWFDAANQSLSRPYFVFTPLPVKENIQTLVKYQWEALETLTPKTDALWLNGEIDETILYDLIEKAWKRRIPLITTNLSNLDQGVLIAFYPDNKKMGERLAEMALKQLRGQPVPLEPLSHISVGVNLRTARHLGFNLKQSKQNVLDLILK
ncbi:MAG: hypothetical protein V3U75_08780 [Methylococcaceae bacterium]